MKQKRFYFIILHNASGPPSAALCTMELHSRLKGAESAAGTELLKGNFPKTSSLKAAFVAPQNEKQVDEQSSWTGD